MDERMPQGGHEHLPPSPAGSRPASAGQADPMSVDPVSASADPGLEDPRALQILSTEHWSLLSARSLVYNEAFARAGMFLTFLSASLVALAFVGNAMGFARETLVLAALLLFVDIVIGLATLGRMLDASVDDLRSIAGMNRIRNAYVRIAPGVATYLSAGIHDDAPGVIETYGHASIRSGTAAFVHGLTTAGGMVLLIDSLLAAALGGVVALIAGADTPTAFVVGGIAFVALFVILNRYAYGVVAGFEATFQSRFPSPDDGSED